MPAVELKFAVLAKPMACIMSEYKCVIGFEYPTIDPWTIEGA